MKKYEPEAMVAVSRYQNWFPTLPEDIQRDVYARMRELLEEEKAYCDKGNHAHMAQILTSIAIYEALRKHGKSEDEAYRIVSEEMWKFLDPSAMQKLAKKSFFLPLMKKIVPFGFKKGSGRGWRYTWHKDDPKDEFRFECNECIYAKILGKRGLMKLGAMCCHADIINYGNLPYTDFIRTQTLCQGGKMCDFRFVRHQTDAGDGWERTKKHLRGDGNMGLFKKFVGQTRKPEGFLGKVMLSGMNSGHAAMADWGFSHLPPITPEKAVDLGCGGGRNAGELLQKYPKAHVTAIDYSELSVEKAKAFNQAAIAAGRCEVRQGDVSDLRLPDSSFDLATAFETVYFWPGLERCFAQVARILKPGGIFMICNESDGADDTGKKYEGIIDGMKCYTVEQLETALKAAGFSGVSSDHHPSKPWITVIARK